MHYVPILDIQIFGKSLTLTHTHTHTSGPQFIGLIGSKMVKLTQAEAAPH